MIFNDFNNFLTNDKFLSKDMFCLNESLFVEFVCN